jgi:hypothetical protein
MGGIEVSNAPSSGDFETQPGNSQDDGCEQGGQHKPGPRIAAARRWRVVRQIDHIELYTISKKLDLRVKNERLGSLGGFRIFQARLDSSNEGTNRKIETYLPVTE